MFTPEQINQISSNENIDKCSAKSITYNSKFKIRAVERYHQDGYSPSMIFKEAGFDLALIGKKRAKDCLADWRKIYSSKGIQGLSNENRGGARRAAKTKYKDDKEKMEYLETKVAYLKAENDFLKKMKKLEKP